MSTEASVTSGVPQGSKLGPLLFMLFMLYINDLPQNIQSQVRLLADDTTVYLTDQESIQSSTTPDPGYQWESDKLTVKHHKREPRGQPFLSR